MTDSRQPTADSRQPTADSRQPTADKCVLELDTDHWSFAPNPEEGFVICCDLSSDDGNFYQLHGRLAKIVKDSFFGRDIARNDVDYAQDLPFFKDSQKTNITHDEITLLNFDHLQIDDLSSYATVNLWGENLWGENKDFPLPESYPYPVT